MPDARDARVILQFTILQKLRVQFGVRGQHGVAISDHGAKLERIEWNLAATQHPTPMEHGARAVKFHKQGHQRQKRQQDHEAGGRDNDIEDALGDVLMGLEFLYLRLKNFGDVYRYPTPAMLSP